MTDNAILLRALSDADRAVLIHAREQLTAATNGIRRDYMRDFVGHKAKVGVYATLLVNHAQRRFLAPLPFLLPLAEAGVAHPAALGKEMTLLYKTVKWQRMPPAERMIYNLLDFVKSDQIHRGPASFSFGAISTQLFGGFGLSKMHTALRANPQLTALMDVYDKSKHDPELTT